jgi:uncharacterized membrane protein YkvI
MPHLSIYAAVATAFLDACVGTVYCVKMLRGQSSPRFTTWLIFEIGVLLSLAAYFTSPHPTLIKAALNATDAVVVSAILIRIVVTHRNKNFYFTANEKLCLAISCVAAAAWAITRTGWVGVAGFQLLMSMAYLPTVESLWQWKYGPAPEPWETWSLNALIGVIGVVTDLTGTRDYVATIYPLRAFLLCALVVALIIRWHAKNKTLHSTS